MPKPSQEVRDQMIKAASKASESVSLCLLTRISDVDMVVQTKTDVRGIRKNALDAAKKLKGDKEFKMIVWLYVYGCFRRFAIRRRYQEIHERGE